MKYVGCMLALFVIGFYSVEAQTLLKPRPQSSFKGYSSEEGLSFYSNPEYKFSERPFKVLSPEEREAPAPRHQVEKLPHDQLPNLQPMGIYPSKNLVPDKTTRYSLIIKNPSNFKVAKGLFDKTGE